MDTETVTPPEPRAYVLRMTPEGDDWVPEALEANQISIGWGLAAELMDTSLDYRSFRDIVKGIYHADEEGYRGSGAVAGMLWRFLREMTPGDYVVVPHGQEFHVAAVDGDALYLPEKVDEHTAFRRPVRWLADRQPIPRRVARARLQSRMKSLKTCVDASDLVDEVVDAIASIDAERPVAFESDLRSRLIDEAKSEMQSGRMDSFGFENLVATVLRALGAGEVRVVARSQDKGVDIIADFSLADTFSLRLGVQAKHYRPEPPVGPAVVDQLLAGMEAEGISFGWVATSGAFSDDAVARKEAIEEERGLLIELVDGDQLAAMIIDGGLRAVGYATAGESP